MGLEKQPEIDFSKYSSKKCPITITDKALSKMLILIENNKKKEQLLGIRINVKQKGCFGLKYNLEYAYDIKPFEAQIQLTYQEEEILLLIDPKAMMFIIGTEVDYIEDKLSSGFVFNNPNEKGRCGCGESFYV